ncbi:MAG TPA: hypothetical protein VFV99_10690 [Kofleriaceae bacterium]|nr:hypothetical protein [Kofleriaceae bacterium]
MGRLVLTLVVCGCSFDHGKSLDDAQLPDDDMMVIDTEIDGPATFGPWSPPMKFPELTDTGTVLDDPTLTDDLLEIYFDTDRLGDDDIFFAKRAKTTDPWGPPTLVANINTTSRESDPELSPDGLTLYFSSDRGGGMGGDDIYMTKRTSRTAAWMTETRVTSLNSAGSDDAPTMDGTKQRVVFFSTRTGGAGGGDLYEAKANGATWTTPARITELNTASNDYDPFLTSSGLGMFFDSDRTGGMGQQDLYETYRPSLTDPFVSPVLLTELNSSGRDMDPWLTTDLRTMVFASDRSGEFEIYITAR